MTNRIIKRKFGNNINRLINRILFIRTNACGVYHDKRGELYYADLSPVVGSEQGGIRPVLVVQNDVGNKYSPTVIAAAVTSQINKAKLPTHIELSAKEYGLQKDFCRFAGTNSHFG